MSHDLHPMVRRVARGVLRFWLGPRSRGADHVPAQGPAIIAANHQSHADSVAVGVTVDRPVRFLGTAELAEWRVLGRWLPKLGMIPINRGEADAAALERLAGLVSAGEVVVIYPEGGRSRDGLVHRPRSGVARLAAATGAPVVPCGIAGTGPAWPPDDRPKLRRHTVDVRYGPPLAPPRDDPRSRRRFLDDLHDRMAKLAGAPMAARHLRPTGELRRRAS